MEEFLASRGHSFIRSGSDSIKTLCPFHPENHPSFVLYERGYAVCFSCQWKGDLVDLLKDLLFRSLPIKDAFRQAFTLARSMGVLERQTSYIPPLKESRDPTPEQQQVLIITQQHYRDILDGSLEGQRYLRQRQIHHPYLLPIGYSSGNNDEYLQLLHKLKNVGPQWLELSKSVGVLSKIGSERLKHRVIFWEIQNQLPLYYQGRSILQESTVRYLCPPGLHRPLLGSFSLAFPSSYCVITEGPFDIAPLWEQKLTGFALMGSELKDAEALIQKIGSREIIIATDSDVAGEKAAASILERIPGRRVIPRHKDLNAWITSEGLSTVLLSLKG